MDTAERRSLAPLFPTRLLWATLALPCAEGLGVAPVHADNGTIAVLDEIYGFPLPWSRAVLHGRNAAYCAVVTS